MKRREVVAGAAAGLLAPVAGLGGAKPLTTDERAVLGVLSRGEPFVATERVIAANAGLPLEDSRAALDQLAWKDFARRDESGEFWRRVEA